MAGRGPGRGNFGSCELGNHQVVMWVQLGNNFALRRNFRTKKKFFCVVFLKRGEGEWKRKVYGPIKVICEGDVLLGDIHWTVQGEATS